MHNYNPESVFEVVGTGELRIEVMESVEERKLK
jgi:hypothetical protein